MATDKELEQQLVEAGNKLVDPPASVDSLLQVLDQVENCLSKVEQSPSESMHDALAPSLKSLVEDQLFKHSNADVRVAVTSCISEITRITAPAAPYDDDQMKDVFKLIVSSFEKLADDSSLSYVKRISILETVAKVRSCVVILDLECDELIAEMFQHFLNGIRDYHPESVFSSMETIMTLVLEESEDISVELLYPLLDSVKKENKVPPVAQKLGEKVLGSSSAKVLPVARRLAEKVLESCAAKVKPYLTNAVKSMEISLNNYSGTVAAICEEISGTIGQNDVHAADENKIGDSKHVEASAEDAAQAVDEAATEAPSPKKADKMGPTNNSSPKLGMSNGVGQPGEDDSLGDSNSSKKEEDGHYTEHAKSLDVSNNNQIKTLDAEKVVNSKNMTEETTENKETKVSSMEPAEPPKNSDIDTDTVMETVPNDKAPSEDIPSFPNKNPPEEADVSSENKNETGSRPSSPMVLEGESVTDASPSVSGSLNEELLYERAERTRKKDILVKDPVLSADDVPQKAFDGTANSEVRPNKNAGRKPPPRISVEDVVPLTADASSKENSTTSEMEEKPLKNLPRKVDASSKNEDGSSLQQSEDKGRRGRSKTVSGRKSKSTTKVDEKVKVASPKSAPKPTIDEPHLETPLTNGKRKRAPVREKVSDAEEYSENVVGAKVKVYWPKDRQYYEGIIESFDPAKKKHKVVYLDGDEEVLNLKRERMRFIADGTKSDEEEVAEQSSDDTSSEMPLKKKMKGNPDCSTKQGKMDDSSLKRSGGTSAGKSRSAGFQSGQKSKSLGKTDGKSVGDLKAVKKREDDNGRKVNHRTPKSEGKSADVALKSTSRNEAEPLVISKAELKRKQALRKKAKSGGFESLNLSPNVFRGIRRKGYCVPTPIQRKTMPLILSGADVVAMARTGSGKTAAFLVPMLEKLQQHVPQGGVRALILSPTRDLALQTLKFTKELGKFTDLRTSLLVGGDSMESQFEELAQNPDIIIATPGRLMHHLTEVEDMSLKTVEYVVFDEADSLFGMGFAEQLHKILTQLSENRQTLLFSATLPSALAEFAKAGLRDPQLVRLDLDTKISPDLKTVFFTLRHEEKYPALLHLIREHISSDQQTLIFVSTKHHAEFLNILFKEEGIEPSVCYGDMDQDARKIHILRFRARKTMLLIVTDVAARGIDIPLLDNVINWDFPPKPKIFVHRVGRAARAGRTGTAFSFVTPEDMPYLLDLHLFLSKPIGAAPTEGEVLQDMDGVMNKIDQAIANGETIYGRFPQSVLDLVSDRIREIIDSSAELTALQRTCKNAFRLYMKTKPAPAKESIKRVKDLPREGLHPIFKHVLGDGELVALAFSECLKAFRPKQTILEAEGEAAKSKNLKGPLSQWTDVVKKKRAVHENVINLVHQQRTDKREEKEVEPEIPSITKEKKASGLKRKTQSFKDEEFYISPVPINHHTEAGLSVRGNEGFGSNRLENAVLDLVADNSEGMQKQKASYHWDKRSKKYVKLNNGERVTASGKVKTESGAKVKASKAGIYEKWKQRSHRKVSLRGTGDGETAEETAGTSGGRHFGRNNRKFGGRQQRSVPNANVRSEIKDFDQVRKERQKKADRMSSMKNKNGKGKKFGKNGKKG